MHKAIIAGLAFGSFFLAGQALAYDTFIPLGYGYATGKGDLTQLTPGERSAIGQADVYETDLWERQLHARQFDTYRSNFSTDRNANGTEDWINY